MIQDRNHSKNSPYFFPLPYLPAPSPVLTTAAGLLDPVAAEGIEQQWMQERDKNERQAQEVLQKLAASLVGDYKVSFLERGI